MVDIHFQSGSLIEKVEKMMNTITKNAKENEEVNISIILVIYFFNKFISYFIC